MKLVNTVFINLFVLILCLFYVWRMDFDFGNMYVNKSNKIKTQ